MKKYIVLFVILFFSFIFCGCGNKKENLSDLQEILKRDYIIVGVKADSAPFGYYKNGVHAGIDIEIAKEIASEIFKDNSSGHIKFVDVNAQNRISKLNSKEVDVLVATVSVNEKRKLVIDFSKPYFVTSSKLLTRKKSNIKNLNYFNSKGRLAVIMGTTGEKIIKLAAPNATLVGAKTYIEAYNYLKNSQVDAVLGDDAILSTFVDDDFIILNRPYSKEYYAVAVRKSENSKELLNKINSVISSLLDSKRFNLSNNDLISE